MSVDTFLLLFFIGIFPFVAVAMTLRLGRARPMIRIDWSQRR